jgi:rhodanese-related sulfurtransferase
MGLLDAVKKAFGRATPTPAPREGRRAAEEAAGGELHVPEVTPAQLIAEMEERNGAGPVLLDIRENFERAQTLIPNSLHIPMNSIPARLAELDREKDIVVYCAHGNRSYGVTGWLMQQGYKARSLKGGIVDWQHKHGPVESGYRPKS